MPRRSQPAARKSLGQHFLRDSGIILDIVGAVRVPSQDGGFTYDWFIRESDLTPEENAKRELQVKEAIEAMKKDLAKVTLPEEN